MFIETGVLKRILRRALGTSGHGSYIYNQVHVRLLHFTRWRVAMALRLATVLNALLVPSQALVCGPALGAPPRPATSARRAAVRGCAVEAEEVLVTSDGGVR